METYSDLINVVFFSFELCIMHFLILLLHSILWECLSTRFYSIIVVFITSLFIINVVHSFFTCKAVTT